MKFSTPIRFALAFISTGFFFSTALAQDSVDVTFSYTKSGVSSVTLVGEFNGWNNSLWPMSVDANALWTRVVRLPVDINPNSDPVKGVPGAWQYKFYYPGVANWPNDPLNHFQNAKDNNNSYIRIKDPTIYHLLPNQLQPIVSTATPTVKAMIFPKVGASIDTSTIAVTIDGTTRGGVGKSFEPATGIFSYTWPLPLPNGSHTMILRASSNKGGSSADTVTFTTQGGYVQITTQGGYGTRNPLRFLRGIVENLAASAVKLIRNGTDTVTVPVVNGAYSTSLPMREGLNTFRAQTDSSGTPVVSDSVSFTYLVAHQPHALISWTSAGPLIILDATGSTDPDSGQTAQLTYSWREDATNPSSLSGLGGSTSSKVSVPRPTAPGEYYFTLIATDPNANTDTTRAIMTVRTNGTIDAPSVAANPAWAKSARIYFLFPKAASPAGTLNAAATKLQYIKDLGFSVIWLMPIMTNASPINTGFGPGYNITDFYTVAPEYGTNADFLSFMNQAHALGLKVILDITPNHSGRFHPWSADAHAFKQDSRYWSWYEHSMITSNTNGLGDCLDTDGFNYYCGFSDQLLNINWNDVDARSEMISVFKYWIQQYGVDGYRFDVYWGPHRRYGEAGMGMPVRDALKHIKPDILLLGEDDGTGGGTETIYADHAASGVNGGLDASYDFKLYFNQTRGFGFTPAAINALHTEIDNGGFYPGPNSLYMRFMESQDEDRITYFYSSSNALDAQTTFLKTMPMASVLFTAPGAPMLWNGQEVGWGYGINGAKEARNRSVINWNYSGKDVLTPHYQKLALIRGQFPAFAQHKRDTNSDGSVTAADSSDFIRVPSSTPIVYAFARPFADQNGLTAVNFSSSSQSSVLQLASSGGALFSGGIQPGVSYYLNDLYHHTTRLVRGDALDSVSVTLDPYGTSVFTLSTKVDTLAIAHPLMSVPTPISVPGSFALSQNYPNPFNPSTMIRYSIPSRALVRLSVYDVLGREVVQLVNGESEIGNKEVRFDGSGLASGVYFARLTSGSSAATTKMILMK